MESTHGGWGSYDIGDACDEILDMGHDDNEETNSNQDEYEPEIGEYTNASKDEEDDDDIHSFCLVYLLLLFSFIFIKACNTNM